MPVLVLVALAVGVPPDQLKAVGLSIKRLMLLLPILVILLICSVPPALWSKLLGVVKPQCAQSAVPSLARATRLAGVAKLPASAAPPGDGVVALAMMEYVLRLFAASVARTRYP